MSMSATTSEWLVTYLMLVTNHWFGNAAGAVENALMTTDSARPKTDYEHPLTFGLSLDPSAKHLTDTLALAQSAEAAGLDLVAIQDHPYQPGDLDALTLAGYVAAHTRRISVFTDVADLQLRFPSMLAKATASLAVQSDGRFSLGVGGGAFSDAITAMGMPAREPTDVVVYTEESLRFLRSAMTGGLARHIGAQLVVPGYTAGPVPARSVPLWLGAQRPRMLDVVGRASDGWVSPLNIYVAPEQVPALQRHIDTAANAAGREPAEVRRIYNVMGAIGTIRGGAGLVGGVELWADTLACWAVELGFDTFVFWTVSAPQQQLDVFAHEVVPAVRERVAALRARSTR